MKTLPLFTAPLAFAAAAAFAQSPAAPALGDERVLFGKYTGAHANDPAYQQTRAALEAAKRDMLEQIYKLTGLTLPDGKKIHVAFNDNPTDAPDPRAVTFATTQPHREGALVTYSLANFHKLPPWVPARPFLQHELVHAIQLCSMDAASYNRIDPWVKEGLAIYAGGEIPSRLRNHYFSCEEAQIAPARMADNLFDGLTRRGKSTDYLEEGLAMLYLARAFGNDALKRFVREITLDKRPWRQSLEAITKQDLPAFEAAAKKFASELFVNLNTALQPLGPRRGELQSQMEAVHTALAQTPASPIAPREINPAPLPEPPAADRPRPSLGLTAQNSPEPDGKGIIITAVAPGSIGQQTGIQVGDAITHFNGQPLKNTSHLRELLEAVKFGDSIPIVVVRDGKAFRATLQFGK